jgi:hypothetical protein
MSTTIAETKQGLTWIRAGWRLYALNPPMWALLSGIWVLVALLLVFVPFGGLIWWLLGPAAYAGFLFAASEQEQGRPIELKHLYVGLTHPKKRAALITLGALTLFGYLIISIVLSSFSFGGAAGPTVQIAGEQVEESLSIGLVLSMALPFILMLVVGALLTAGLMYSAPLVLFGETDGLEAIMTSAEMCTANWRSVAVVGSVYLAVAALGFLIFVLPQLAILPFAAAVIAIAVGVLIVAPVSFCASYLSFCDIVNRSSTE